MILPRMTKVAIPGRIYDRGETSKAPVPFY
jgi:hypothetical protein